MSAVLVKAVNMLTLLASRLHVLIEDQDEEVYQVPTEILPRPNRENGTASNSELRFSYTASPFSFAVTRKSSGEVLFNTSGAPLIFESQYLNLRTSLPQSPNLYGLGKLTSRLDLVCLFVVRG